MTSALETDINTDSTTNVNSFNTTGDSVDVDNACTASAQQPVAPTTIANRNLNSHTNDTNGSNANNFNNNTSNMSSTNGSQRVATETGKRKKLKSRTATIPAVAGNVSGGYVKDNLDAWLETCLRDASNAQLSSSSEFLDYNPMPPSGATTNSRKCAPQQMSSTANITAPQQQQRQQQSKQAAYISSSSSNTQQQLQQQQQLSQQSQQAQQQFAVRTNFPGPMPFSSVSGSGPAPFNHGFQRSVPNFMKYMSSYNNRYPMLFPPVGGISPSPSGYYQQNDGQEFASLPPIVNMMGGSSEMENNSTDVLDGSGSNPNISRGFSDPCLLNPSDNDSKLSGQITPDCRNNVPSELENNKFFSALMEQIALLHETNTKICRNLHETKVDIEALKHAPTWGMRHRRDSLSGLSTHSQPMVFGGGFGGMQSPAPTYHSGAYTPGMMTDVVREVKEAARVREDALLNRVKAMVDERQWSFNECNARLIRDIEELKSQLHHLRADRKESNRRITHLEAENKYMRQMLTTLFNQRQAPDIIYENESLRPQRKMFHHCRRTQPLSLHYGTIHHQPPPTPLTLEEQEEQRLHIVEAPSSASKVDLTTMVSGGTVGGDGERVRSSELRNSFSSSDGGGSIGAGASAVINGVINSNASQLMSPPNFSIVSPPTEDLNPSNELLPRKITAERSGHAKNVSDADVEPDQFDETKYEAHELQQELSEAVAARKEADNRIIALENMVKALRLNSNATSTIHHPSMSEEFIANNSGVGSRGFTGISTTSHITVQQQQQKQQQYHRKQHKADTIASSSVSGSLLQSPPKLSVAGPVTDL